MERHRHEGATGGGSSIAARVHARSARSTSSQSAVVANEGQLGSARRQGYQAPGSNNGKGCVCVRAIGCGEPPACGVRSRRKARAGVGGMAATSCARTHTPRSSRRRPRLESARSASHTPTGEACGLGVAGPPSWPREGSDPPRGRRSTLSWMCLDRVNLPLTSARVTAEANTRNQGFPPDGSQEGCSLRQDQEDGRRDQVQGQVLQVPVHLVRHRL